MYCVVTPSFLSLLQKSSTATWRWRFRMSRARPSRCEGTSPAGSRTSCCKSTVTRTHTHAYAHTRTHEHKFKPICSFSYLLCQFNCPCFPFRFVMGTMIRYYINCGAHNYFGQPAISSVVVFSFCFWICIESNYHICHLQRLKKGSSLFGDAGVLVLWGPV